jgi:voltage-gated potassium channel
MISTDDLRRIPLFAELSDDALARVAGFVTAAPVEAGHILIHVGQAANGLFILQDGAAIVERPDGTKVELGPGSFFGELALLTERSRTARVQITVDSTVLALSRSDFQRLLESEPDLAVAMLKGLAERIAGEG